jgi:hypothetical protein
MLIFYTVTKGTALDPVVICDYTRSDEQYSIPQIQTFVNALGAIQNPGKAILPINPLNIFSLDYKMSYSHGGAQYGDSLKTKFTAQITNPPQELISLLNIKQYGSSQNIQKLSSSLTNAIIDPQVQFPTGAFVLKPNANATLIDSIKRTFMVYSTEFNYDERRTNAFLTVNGASFDSMVIRLKFSADIDARFPLIPQIQRVAASSELIVTADPSLSALLPIVSKYYAPQPAAKIINQICLDNNLMSDFDQLRRTIKIKSLSPDAASLFPQEILCFNGMVPGAKILNLFALQNYYSCEIESELFDAQLFDYVTVYDDSMTAGQFTNLNETFPPITTGSTKIKGYKFYLLQYTLEDSRLKTVIKFRGTNNWLLSNFKIDAFLENKIYTGLSV